MLNNMDIAIGSLLEGRRIDGKGKPTGETMAVVQLMLV